jgi:hypothetical protein
MSARRRLIVLVAAIAFGLLAGAVHGNDGGLRGALGNLSAPWLLVAIIPAWRSRSWKRGAVLGLVATLAALLGFYVAMTLEMTGHLGNVDGNFFHLLRYVVTANRVWFAAGLISGPTCGAVSGALGARRNALWLGLVIGALMIGELVLMKLIAYLPLPLLGTHAGWANGDWRAYYLQGVAGLLVASTSALAWKSGLCSAPASDAAGPTTGPGTL